MKASMIHKILFGIEIIPLSILLLFALIGVMSTSSAPIVFIGMLLSFLSIISLIYILAKAIFNTAEDVRMRFVYLSHTGLLLTILGLFAGFFKSEFVVFSVGLIACIPYFHVMVLYKFFRT